MASPDPKHPDLEAFVRLIERRPFLAPEFERIAAYAQGKGFGTASVTHEVELVWRLVKTTPLLAIDIGGNVGEYTAQLRSKHPNLEIHVFEPSSINIERLKRRFAADEKIKLVPLAVSDASGPAMLFSNEAGSVLASLTKRKLDHFNIDFGVQEPVSTIRFEEYWTKELQKRPLDIIKIDIEGHELAALNGFGEAVKATRILQFEFGGANIDTRTYFRDFWYFFKQINFDIYRITPFGLTELPSYEETLEFFSVTNYIAVNRNR